MTSELVVISDDIQARVNGRDPEADHSKADDLLCKTIECLAAGTPNEGTAQEIVERFNPIKKLYA